MSAKRRLLFVVLTVCLIGLPGSAECSDRMGYYKIMDRFFELLQEQKPGEAVDALYKSNPYMNKIANEVEQLRAQFVLASTNTLGKYHDHEILIDKEIVGRYAYLYVFVAYDRQPLRMEFHFYRPQDKWVIQSFSYGVDIDDDISAFAKYELMK